jgi:hypothetical protein
VVIVHADFGSDHGTPLVSRALEAIWGHFRCLQVHCASRSGTSPSAQHQHRACKLTDALILVWCQVGSWQFRR